jgi:hypothetical protein
MAWARFPVLRATTTITISSFTSILILYVDFRSFLETAGKRGKRYG